VKASGPRAAAPPGRGGIASRLRAELGPPPRRDVWPPVSIVVVNRDGREHLELLLARLAGATDYPDLELVLVDNASSDGSVELARSVDLPFPLVVVENDDNLSFADANNDGVERARSDLVLLLNNDVEPFEPGWLKELVDCLEREAAAAVGATLLHGAKHRDRPGGGYVLQHRGVELVREAGFVVPFNSGDGEELQPFGAADLPRPACTAACLLVRRDAFDSVGGFTTGFRWGWEDVDLGFKLNAAGERVLCSGRSVLFHHESSTRGRAGREWSRRTRRHNQRLFMRRWGPQARREYMLDRIGGSGFWTDHQPVRLAVVLAGDPDRDLPMRELGDAIECEGWHVTPVAPIGDGWEPLPSDVDVVVVADPGFAASIPRGVDCVAWAGELIGEWLASPLALRAEVTLAGHPAVEDALERAGIGALRFPGAVNLDRLGEPSPAAARQVDCLVVADREDFVPEWAIALKRCPDLRAAVVGAGWDGAPAFGLGSAATSADAWSPDLATAAPVVIHASPPDGRRGPLGATVVFDALMAGALPLSDDEKLVEGLLAEVGIPTWSSAEELERLLHDLTDDEDRRRELVERGAALVRAEHTWACRARELVAALRGRAERLRFCLRVSEPWGAEPSAVLLRLALERRGHSCLVQLRDEWEALDGLTADVVVAFGDVGNHLTDPAQLNVLVATDAVRPTECDQWDIVLVPDEEAAGLLQAHTPSEVVPLDFAAANDPAAELLARIDASAARRDVPRVVTHA
jgi:GT2 family glycosyltransferase